MNFYETWGEKLRLDWKEINEDLEHKFVVDVDFLFPPFRVEILDVGDGFETGLRYEEDYVPAEEAVGQDGDVILTKPIKYKILREAQFAVEDSLRRAVQGDCDWA